MEFGKMRDRITISKKEPGSGPYAEASYKKIADVFAFWEEINSVEMIKNESLQGYRYANVIIRKINIDGTCKITKNNEDWDIIGHPRQVKPGYIEFKVQRKVAG